MSLWSKVEPLCGRFPITDAFRDVIENNRYGCFSKKICGVSGYYQAKFVLIVLGLLRKKEEGVKKVFYAILLHTASSPYLLSPVVFKRGSFFPDVAGRILNSFALQAGLYNEFPDAVAKPPILLGRRHKEKGGKLKIRLDTLEELYPSTLPLNCLVKQKMPLQRMINGLFHMAEALRSFHQSGYIHGDIKNWNVFLVDRKLMLFDFDLTYPIPSLILKRENYEFWDRLSNRGVKHGFCDVYGWTLVLANLIWGEDFYKWVLPERNKADYQDTVHEFYQFKFGEIVNIPFYNAAYLFIQKIFKADIEAHRIISQARQTAVFMPTLKAEIERLPTMKSCLDFIRPWVVLEGSNEVLP